MWRAVASLLCAMFVLAPAAPALAQPGNGQLAVVLRDRIVAVNEDGTGLRPLYTPASGGEITGPAWSPDGNQLAFSYQDKINVLDLSARSVTSLTTPGPGGRDVEPAWLADGRIGFRRIRTDPLLGATLSQTRERVGLNGVVGASGALELGVGAMALTANFETFAYREGNWLLWSGHDLELVRGAADTPAWSADASQLAYVDTGSVDGAGLRIRNFVGTARNEKVTDLPAAAPRWAPAGDKLAFVRAGQVLTVPARANASAAAVSNIAGATAVDWQPCTTTTVGCRSVLAPTCNPTTAQVTTQTDQPVELPAAPCVDPAGLPLHVVLVSGGEHGSVTGSVYTPRPGFVGQDVVTYRMSNGSAVSDLVRVTVFVVPRPLGGAAPGRPSPQTIVTAPFLSAPVKPVLDRKRRARARLVCDQGCSFTIRLQADVRGRKKPLKGPVRKGKLKAGAGVALRLELPAKPKGKLKKVVITGTVRGDTGLTRPVKLPVTVHR